MSSTAIIIRRCNLLRFTPHSDSHTRYVNQVLDPLFRDARVAGCYLGTLVILDANGTLGAETVGPEATKLDVGLRNRGMGEEQPSTEDWLGKNIQDSVGDDLLVNVHVARAIGDTPNAKNCQHRLRRERGSCTHIG